LTRIDSDGVDLVGEKTAFFSDDRTQEKV